MTTTTVAADKAAYEEAVADSMTADKYRASFVWVSPEIAQRWLLRNVKNRRLAQALVAVYATDMRNGRWIFDGATIKFSESGQLLDGQHRLHAVIASGATVLMLIVRGLPDESQVVMDTGRKRAAADMFGLDGKENASLLAATARLVAAYNAGKIKTADSQFVGTYSNPELRDVEAADPMIGWAVRLAARARADIPANPAAIAFAAWLTGRVDADDARRFFSSLAEMRTEGVGDPRYTLLSRLVSAQRNRERLTSIHQAFYIVKAWNAWRVGGHLKTLKSHTASGASNFPEPV